MKVAAITGPRQCSLVDKPDPKPAGDIVVVKVHAAPMCTEYKAYAAGWGGDCLGHEAAGEVVQVAQPGRVSVGDRVVVMPLSPCGTCPHCLAGQYIHCQKGIDPVALTGSGAGNATYAQYLLKSDWMLLPIPEGISYDHASMACCGLGPTFGAMQRMNAGAFDTVLITGLGPVGLGGVINAVYRGAKVIAVDTNAYRGELAKKLGAAAVVDPSKEDALQQILDLSGGGIDKAVDCSGVPAAQRLMIDALKRRGEACFVGEAGDLTIAVSNDMIRKGISLHGQWHWSMADAPLMMKLIADSTDKLNTLITHTFPMSEAGKAWELQLTGRCGKIVLHPW
ncbi:MAG: zinc-binding dehydrogenase [Planctomycetaceae bacterium]|nr:zinc-binding dehydrogenase [Planctomycetaceae bacterium]